MADASETKVTRRDAILTTGKAAVAFGAAALLAGRLPQIHLPNTTRNVNDDMDLEIPTGGLATVAVTYMGNDDDETPLLGGFTPTEAPEVAANDTSNLIELGLVPIQFVISEIDTSSITSPTYGGTPVGNFNSLSVMTVGSKIGDKGRHFLVHVWYQQTGFQAILPASAGPNIVVGQSVDVEALEDAVRGPPFNLGNLTINASGHTYLLLGWGSLSPNAP